MNKTFPFLCLAALRRFVMGHRATENAGGPAHSRTLRDCRRPGSSAAWRQISPILALLFALLAQPATLNAQSVFTNRVLDLDGTGFAIPVNMAKEIVPQLREKGHVTRGWLGVGIQKITPELAKSFGLKDEKGALVSQVVKGGPADKAGIETGDVIIEFDGMMVADSNDLPRMVAPLPVGKTVPVKVLRGGNAVDREVKIGQLEEQKEDVANASTRKPLGMSVQNITPEIAKALRLKSETGVLVASVIPGSPAAKADIRSGDVIQQANKSRSKT